MSTLGNVLFGVSVCGALLVLLGTGGLVSVFLQGQSSDRRAGVVIGVVGVSYAALPALAWWLQHRTEHVVAGTVLAGALALCDVLLVVFLWRGIEAAARP